MIQKQRINHVDELMIVLKKCPDPICYDDYTDILREYLIEITERENGLLDNLIDALELYLEK